VPGAWHFALRQSGCSAKKTVGKAKTPVEQIAFLLRRKVMALPAPLLRPKSFRPRYIVLSAVEIDFAKLHAGLIVP
jgi:hypothetical protein